MAINLTVSAENAAEFFQQLRGLSDGFFAQAASTGNQPKSESHEVYPSDPVMPEVAAAEKVKRTRRTAEQIASDNAAAAAQQQQEAPAEQGAGKQTGAEMSLVTSATAQDNSKTAGTSTSVVDAAVSASDDAKPLDFDKDVAPVVLGYVKSHTKPWVVAILNQFGVERASEMPADQWPELINALNDAAAA